MRETLGHRRERVVRLLKTAQVKQAIAVVDPPLWQFRIGLNHLAADTQTVLPILHTVENMPTNLQHVVVIVERLGNQFQFGQGRRQIAQFHPPLCPGQIMRVRRLKFPHLHVCPKMREHSSTQKR